MNNQPTWQLLANIGDINPIDHGGQFVYKDLTGTYAPKLEILIPPDYDLNFWRVYRFFLDQCTFIDGILSDNKYHPESKAWFFDDIERIASFIGSTKDDLIEQLCSEDPIQRAFAYQAISDYHGMDNFDESPLEIETREAVEARYFTKQQG